MDNPAPKVFEPAARAAPPPVDPNDYQAEYWQPWYIYDLLRDIQDPEHPHSLEELRVLSEDLVSSDRAAGTIRIAFRPTVPHCSLATLIGLSIRTKLALDLPMPYKLDIVVVEGTHDGEDQINRQVNDKERVQSAMENPDLMRVVHRCIGEAVSDF